MTNFRNCRNLINEIIVQRKHIFKALRLRNQTEEEFVDGYLKEKIVPIWPKGWMKLENLKKEFLNNSINRKPKENKKPTNGSNATSSSMQKDVKSTQPSNNNVMKQSTTATLDKILLSGETSLQPTVTISPVKSSALPKTDRQMTEIYAGTSTAAMATDSVLRDRLTTAESERQKSKVLLNGTTDNISPTKRASDHSIIHIISSQPASIELKSPSNKLKSIAPVVLNCSPTAATVDLTMEEEHANDLRRSMDSSNQRKIPVDQTKYKKKMKLLSGGNGNNGSATTATSSSKNSTQLNTNSDSDCVMFDDDDISNVNSTLHALKELEVSK